jgi:FkbM family methyltransferase
MRLRQRLDSSKVGRPFISAARSVYRPLRTLYLQSRCPDGGFVIGNGVQVFCDFNDESYVWYDADAANLAFDQRVIRTVLNQVPGNVFLDVGAHFGFYAAFVAGLNESGARRLKVIALEPDKTHFRCLQRTVGRFARQRVTALPLAAGEFDGLLQLHKSSDATCLHTYSDETTEPTYVVESLRIDTICQRYLAPGDRVAFMKIDVDGAEPFVLAGATTVMQTHAPVTLLEFAPKLLRRSGTDVRAFYRDLCDRGDIYWLRYQCGSISRITDAHYRAVVENVGDGITDLLVAPTELKFDGFPVDVL